MVDPHATVDGIVADLAAHLDGRMVACAESCTGGMVASALARAEGSGSWFRGGIVAYRREAKFSMLGVTPGPVVTERAAIEMADGVAARLGADAAVAVTGAAGPQAQDGAAPGTVVVAVRVDDHTDATVHHFDGDPRAVCDQARDAALRALGAALRQRCRGDDVQRRIPRPSRPT